MTIRVLLADDHTVVREGLAAIINGQEGMEVVAEAADAHEAVALAAETRPDLVIMDISMPDGGGIEATRLIKRRAPKVQVLMLTIHEDKELLLAALDAGAGGYVLKQAVKSQLVHAVDTVLRGELYLHPVMSSKLVEVAEQATAEARRRARREAEAVPHEELTPREIDVLRLIAQGYTNRQAAQKLQISPRTVEFHRGNLTEKLGFHGRVELVRYAEEHDLL